MLKNLTLEEVQAAAPGSEIVEAGTFFRSTSCNAKSAGCLDYINVLLPRALPIDKDGDPIPVGEFPDLKFLELTHALGGELILIRTGKFIPPTEEDPAPAFELRHPKDSQDIAVHVAWNQRRGYPIRDSGGRHGPFGAKYGASWYKRYPVSSCLRSGPCPHDCCGEDVWILPANGPIKHILDYLSAQTEHKIAEGDTAAKISEEAEREYQAHKAEYRAELEQSDLIDRFKKAYGCDECITFELKDDFVEIVSPLGTDRVRYDAKCMATIRRSVESAERCNLYEDIGLFDALAGIAAVRAIASLLF